MSTTGTVTCVVPLYNDWESFAILVKEIAAIAANRPSTAFKVVAVNDGSTEQHPVIQQTGIDVKVINLNINVGHQRAIAIGLSYISETESSAAGYVIVMDSDGEDKPADITKLLDKAESSNNQKVIFARRHKRSEGPLFRAAYFVYKQLFHLLTGQSISFGNFSCLPTHLLSRIVALPDLWNHYSGGILKSRIPYDKVDTDRGKRYAGLSKMNYQNLILHGLSAISIYMDILSVRLLILAFSGIVLSTVSIIVVLAVKVLTGLAIPGWASNVSLLVINIIIQFFSITLMILLLQLNNRNNVRAAPKDLYKNFILSID